MKKLLLFSVIISFFIFGFSALKSHLASYLLQKELTSDEYVRKITESSNNPVTTKFQPIFNNQKADMFVDNNYLITQIKEHENDTTLNVLGADNEKWIEVNLGQQRVYAWEGNNRVMNFLVSTGKWAPTPVGDYKVWIKLANTTMKGGSKALGTYYYLPNVPCVMYFYKGYGLHGTYWHNNFGTPMSHGCVNLKTDDACQLYNWASVGTKVSIHK